MSSVDFLKPIFTKYRVEMQRPMGARLKALALVKKGAESGSLSKSDLETLYSEMRTAGIAPEHLEADAAFVIECVRHERAAAESEERRERARQATSSLAALEDERSRLMEQMNQRHSRLVMEEREAGRLLDEAAESARQCRAMKKARPELVGPHDRERACLLLADSCGRMLAEEYPTSLSPALVSQVHELKIQTMIERISGHSSQPIPDFERYAETDRLVYNARKEQRAAIEAARARDEKAAEQGLRILRIIPDKLVPIDVTDFDFCPAPDQAPAEFAKLVSLLSAKWEAEQDFARKSVERMRLTRRADAERTGDPLANV